MKTKKLQQKSTAIPFRRVKAEEVDVDHRLKDNSFDAKVSSIPKWEV